MRLRAFALALAVVAGLAAPVGAAGDGNNRSGRRLGAAYAKKRAATPSPAPKTVPVPPLVNAKSRVQSSGVSCRSSAKG